MGQHLSASNCSNWVKRVVGRRTGMGTRKRSPFLWRFALKSYWISTLLSRMFIATHKECFFTDHTLSLTLPNSLLSFVQFSPEITLLSSPTLSLPDVLLSRRLGSSCPSVWPILPTLFNTAGCSLRSCSSSINCIAIHLFYCIYHLLIFYIFTYL